MNSEIRKFILVIIFVIFPQNFWNFSEFSLHISVTYSLPWFWISCFWNIVLNALKRGFMMKCEKTAFCPGSCPTRRYLPSDCLFSHFWRQNFAPNVYSWSSRDAFQFDFEWRRWVHFYLNQETEIVITKKSKSSHNIGAISAWIDWKPKKSGFDQKCRF